MRVDDVGRRIASSSGPLLWQESGVEIIRVTREKRADGSDSDSISPASTFRPN